MSDAKGTGTNKAGVPDSILPAESVDESGSPLIEEGQKSPARGDAAKDKASGATSPE